MPDETKKMPRTEAEWRGRKFTLVDTGGIGLLRGVKMVRLLRDVIAQLHLESRVQG